MAAVGSTPPPTPPLSPGKAYEKQVESSVERLLGTTQSDHDDLTDHESSPRSLDSTAANVDKNKNAISSPPSQLPANQRLRLPSRSAPIRGSRRKPSRNRNSDNSSKGLIRSSHESLSQASAAETRSANDTSDVYERLKDGESLEGWRTECTPTTSTAPTPAETPSQTPLNAELYVRRIAYCI